MSTQINVTTGCKTAISVNTDNITDVTVTSPIASVNVSDPSGYSQEDIENIAGLANKIFDGDSDTYIDVEESEDEDVIRFYVNGTEALNID